MNTHRKVLHIEQIGFIPTNRSFDFCLGEIKVVESFNASQQEMKTRSNKDGFLYPPQIATFQMKDSNLGVPARMAGPLPNSTKPASLYKLPASHEIRLLETYTDDPLNNECLFLVQFLAFLFSTRAHVTQYWIDRRIPLQKGHDYVLHEPAIPKLVNDACKVWIDVGESSKRLFLTNLLTMHNRVFAYNWDWEQFLIAYTVFDGCYKFLIKQGVISPSKSHAERWNVVMEKIGIPPNPTLLKLIVGLRNSLFHETLWDGGQPCTGRSRDAFMSSSYIKKICARVLLYILGYRGEYLTESNWWTLGSGCVLK